jgi:TonB-linked SusC/RagA family outer membrane protein
MKKILLMLFVLVGTASIAIAQRTVRGTVTDEAGVGLVGATVIVKGTSIGTTTNMDGLYTIQVPAGSEVLVVSYTGFDNREVTLGTSNVLDVSLTEGVSLSEVVVTGFTTDRNARNVTYANQTVSSDDLNSQPNRNALEGLRGKAAGVKINTGSGGVGASSRVVLRGESSLTGNNNALIVVDGIAIDNSSTRGGAGFDATSASAAQDGYSDFGNRFNDLNPNEIESITILKGPAATALYGSRGSSGVLLVTTKKGAAGQKLKVNVNSSFSLQQAYLLLERQDKFGQGYDNSHFDSGENWSWGPAFDGVVRPWTSPIDSDGDGALESLVRPYSAVPNQIQDFFNTGQTIDNSVSISGSDGGFTYYAAYSNLNQQGILDNTENIRNTLSLRATAKLSPKLETNFGLSYASTRLNTAQEGYRPFEGQNAYANAIQAPVNIPYNELRDYNSPFHNINGYYGSYSTNPYFILNEYGNNGKFDNYLGNVALTYRLAKNFSISGNIGLNTITRTLEASVPKYTPDEQLVWVDDLALTTRNTRNTSPGQYTKTEGKNTNLDATIKANYSYDITRDLNLNVTAGYNLFDRRTSRVTGETAGGLVVPGWYHFDNSAQVPKSTQQSSKYQLFGILGNVALGWRNQIFLEYSARNDWSSTLPKDNNSFFYQGVGLSAILTDMLRINTDGPMSFLKVRGGIGTIGKDASPYLLESSFIGNPVIQTFPNHNIQTPINGQPGFTVSDVIGNPNLRPELTTLYEVGADVGFFDNRINVEYTYYTSIHSDQIIEVDLPSSSGFRRTTANVGKMTNKGHELSINLRPIQGLVKDLTWDINLIYAKNTNEVTFISNDAKELTIGGPYTNSAVSLVAAVGLPFGTYKSTVPMMTDDGKMIVGSDGFPVLTATEQYLGAYQPDWTGSVGTMIGYKGFSVNALVDIRQGGQFLSITKNQTEFNGTALSTLIGNREPFVIPNSVVQNADGTFSENTTEVTAQELYAISGTAFGGNSLLIDASFVKLRELGLTYTVPQRMLQGTSISRLSLGVFGSNLKFWLPSENTYADPEVNGADLNGNAVGVETTQIPPSRSYGVRLNVTF